MTLEDFFTLTEMKDGLTAPPRVHELISVMQKEKDSVVKNIGEASRQWAAVASTIVATENKDCLELFIQLDGLGFIDRWLKDALKYGCDSTDSFIEESIASLLKALEKLQIDMERSVSSGIWITINNLLDHRSSRIQDRAQMLVDRWKQGQVGDVVSPELQSVSSRCDTSVLSGKSDNRQRSTIQVSKHEAHMELDTNSADPSGENMSLLKSSDSGNSEGCQSDKSKQNDELLVCRSMEDKPLDGPTGPTTSMTSGSGHESPSRTEKVPIRAPGADQSHLFSVPKVDCLEPPPYVADKHHHFLNESDVASSNLKHGVNTSNVTSSNNVAESVGAPTIKSEDAEFRAVTTAFEGVEKPVCLTKCNSNVIGDANKCETHTLDGKVMDGQFDSHTDQDSSDHEGRLDKAGEAGTSYSRMDIDVSDNSGGGSSDEAEGFEDISRFSKPVVHKRSPNFTYKKIHDSDLDYGIVDALEVARQVAQDVERQVEDYKEPACSSSSEKILKIGFRQPGSPDSVSGKPENPVVVPPEDVSSRQNHSAEAYAEGEGRLIVSNNVDPNVDNGANEQESSQVTEVAQEPKVNDARGFCGLDLNQEVCSEEIDTPQIPVCTTASVVSASRLAPVSGSPAGCVQFQGALGWKGSSATSAFRPASPCKMLDSDRTHETSRFYDSLQKRKNLLDIDLNITEDGDEKAIEFKLGRPTAVSTGFHFRDSSLEVGSGSRRSERPNLDLNRLSDDGDALPSNARTERQLFFPGNGHLSPSPASSSSSLQPSRGNFDLNDRPLFPNDSFDQGLYLGQSSQNAGFRGSRARDPVISLFGAKVEVGNRRELSTKDFIPQAQLLPNGLPPQPAIDMNISRMGGVLGMVPTAPYSHPSAFGYNAMTAPPGMYVPPAMYGPGSSIPYMLDSIGSHIVPQVVGSSSGVPLSFAQQPFFMSMTGAPLSLNGMVPSQPMFDLNSGGAVEGANPGGIRQFLMPGQGRSLEEHLGSNSQASSSSGAGAKRKEPDNGWEPLSLHYKHPTPPWR